jgi:four helix bundle protein
MYMKVESFKDLIVWQKSMILVRRVYEITSGLPKDEIYALSSQLRRSSISIPSNIAEGFRRGSTKDYTHFLKISLGSSAELETQLILVNELYPSISTQKIQEALNLSEEIQKILSTIIKKLIK